jgi:opacity protein-like surface antigen
MKKILLASAAILAVSAMPAAADGAPTMTGCGCWYAGLSAGGNAMQDETAITAFSGTISTSFDTGWALSAQVGYRFENGFRTELEFAYRKNDVDSVDYFGPVTDASGDVSQTSLIANVLYDIHLTDDLSLSLGAGAGLAGASINVEGLGGPLVVDKGDGWGFAWQLIGGVNWSLSPDTELYAEYHYMRNDRHDVTTFPAGFPRDTGMNLENSSAMLGVRFAFGR